MLNVFIHLTETFTYQISLFCKVQFTELRGKLTYVNSYFKVSDFFYKYYKCTLIVTILPFSHAFHVHTLLSLKNYYLLSSFCLKNAEN